MDGGSSAVKLKGEQRRGGGGGRHKVRGSELPRGVWQPVCVSVCPCACSYTSALCIPVCTYLWEPVHGPRGDLGEEVVRAWQTKILLWGYGDSTRGVPYVRYC